MGGRRWLVLSRIAAAELEAQLSDLGDCLAGSVHDLATAAVLLRELRPDLAAVDGDLLLSLLTERESLQAQVRRLEAELAGRREVDRAKVYLAQHLGLKEAEAYRLMQKASMDQRRPLRQVAADVLGYCELEGRSGKGGSKGGGDAVAKGVPERHHPAGR
ncbi:MAG: ANTAR domain-containing protein [Thermaerobacter sp.]|jgi:hypothetical protein|nr:ANTAR domain-containing protein [Thermaerobacter sp.]